jgi:hypothetical protein
MPQLSLTCPHCETAKIGFSPLTVVPYKHGVPLTLMFMQCQGCGGGIIAVVKDDAPRVEHWKTGFSGHLAEILTIYPELKQHEAPADIPDNVRRAFLSGLENLKLPNGANAAAMMFRRSIELSAKTINPMVI